VPEKNRRAWLEKLTREVTFGPNQPKPVKATPSPTEAK